MDAIIRTVIYRPYCLPCYAELLEIPSFALREGIGYGILNGKDLFE